MTLFDHYLEYMTQLLEGRRSPPEGITLPEGDVTEKAASLSRQLQQMGATAFVRACAHQDGVTLPEEIYRQADDTTAFSSCCKAPYSRPPYRRLPRRRSPPRRPRIPMQASTPSRCFWTAWRWMTVWCST
jgi:hypothetical protein